MYNNFNIQRKADNTNFNLEQFRKDIKDVGLEEALENYIERIVSLELDIEDLQSQIASLEERIQVLEEKI